MRLHLTLLAALCILPLAAAADTLTHIRIDTPEAPSVASDLIAEGFDVLPGTVYADSLELIVSPAELALLEQRGYAPVTLAKGRPFQDIQAERLETGPTGADGPPPGYPDLAEVINEMVLAAAQYPAICQFVDLTETYNMPVTFEGRHLYALKISDNVEQDEDEPAILFVSTHHAREIVVALVALYGIEQFTTQYGIDPQITALVDEYEIWIAPMWNPDGYNWVFVGDNMWRKNRRVFPQGIGVDQNRNYPFGWESPCCGSSIVTSETYRGPEPASEPETQTMIAWAEDRRFVKVADYHSYAREVRYGFGCWNHPFVSFLQSEAAALAATAAGYSPNTSCCTGGDIHYHMGTKGSHAFLWETHTSFQPSYASALGEAALVFPGMMFFLERPISISGHVTDAITGEPVIADLVYVGVNFENGETNGSGARFGRYHGILPAGSYTLEFSAEGYLTQQHDITVTLNSAEVLDVQLMPLALSIHLIDGPGELVPPGTAPPVQVEITPGAQQIVPGSETMFYRYDGGTFLSQPLTNIGGGLYTATLPAVQCGDTPEFYFSAEGDLGTVVTLPPNAPTSVFAFDVGEIVELYHFNFETSPDWFAENLGATSGDWQRGVPVNDPNWDYDPISDSDGSGQCWLTQNEFGNTDVDGGAVRLTSSVFDLSAGDVTISYDYFLRLTDTGGGVDRLLVEISSNDLAGPWIEIARHTSDGGLSWRTHEIDQEDLNAAGVTMTPTMRLRWTTNDADPQSINESGLDALSITTFVCQLFQLGDLNCDGELNAFDIDPFVLALTDPAGYTAAWPDCDRMLADCNGDGVVNAFDIDPFVELLTGP